MERVPERQLFIGGAFVPPVGGGRLPVICPFTEQAIGSIPAATAKDVEAAVEAAASAVAARQWTTSTGAHRARYLRAVADKVKERKSQLARLETLDMGKPIAESEWDMDDVAGCFEYYAGGLQGVHGWESSSAARGGRDSAWRAHPSLSKQPRWLPPCRRAYHLCLWAAPAPGASTQPTLPRTSPGDSTHRAPPLTRPRPG